MKLLFNVEYQTTFGESLMINIIQCGISNHFRRKPDDKLPVS